MVCIIAVQIWRNPIDSPVQRYHIYKDVWQPVISKILHAEQELENAVDKFAVNLVVKNDEKSRPLLISPCKCSQILWYFISRGGKICEEVTGRRCHCKQLCRGMEIPCRLVFSCSIQIK